MKKKQYISMPYLIKSIFVLLGIVMLLFLNLSIALAHPGGTDAQGGHYDHSTGEYHYHHGYPAHQHPNGVCPYEDEDEYYVDDTLDNDYEDTEEDYDYEDSNSTRSIEDEPFLYSLTHNIGSDSFVSSWITVVFCGWIISVLVRMILAMFK